MGEVYRARDSRLGREVALKVLPAEFAAEPDRRSRFEREARAASALNHPNIVTVHDVGSADGLLYVAMELVVGRTLREALARGPLPLKKLLDVAAQVADGLAKAHAAGITHRDLKPENLMLSQDGFAKILDFGLAKQQATGSAEQAFGVDTQSVRGTGPGVVLGTVGYMSPEQAKGEQADFRSDQFSLGAVLYEMASGRRAFERPTAVETLSAIIREEPRPIDQIAPGAPAPLRWLIERCLSKDPEERYASTRDLAHDLRSLRDHLSGSGSAAAVAVARPEKARRPSRLAVAFLAAAVAAWLAFVQGKRSGQGPRGDAVQFQRVSYRLGAVWSARFAPDGQTVVYGAAWEGQPIELFETRLGSSESRPLGLGSASVLAISTSGEMALSLRPRFIYNFLQYGTLGRMALSGRAPREGAGDVHAADWSPDGKELAIARSVAGKDQLEYPEGHVVYESRGILHSLRVSPDGQRVGFLETVDFVSRVVAVSAKSAEKRVLCSGFQPHSVGLAWPASGREIWFTGTRTVWPELRAVDLDGHERVVYRVPGSLHLMDIFRDGRVLMARGLHRTGIVVKAPGQDREKDLSWLDNSFLGGLSPDGQRVAFTEDASEGFSLLLRPTDGSPAISLGDGYSIHPPQDFSPDGRWLAVEKRGRILLVPTQGGETRVLPAGAIEAFRGIRWTGDGKALVVAARERGHGDRLYRQALDGSSPQPAGPEGQPIRSFVLSPDGSSAALLLAGGKIVLRRFGSGDAPRDVAGAFPEDTLIGWSSDGRSLFCNRTEGPPGRIHRLDIATGERRTLLPLTPPDPAGLWRIQPVAVTPDGRSYAYSYSRRLDDLYVFEGIR